MSESTVGDCLRPQFIPILPPSSELTQNAHNIGIEWEFENALFAESRYLTVIHDNSLRDSGLEFIFRQPLYGQQIINAIDEMMEIIDNNDFIANERTSTHIHFDVRDLTFKQTTLFAIGCSLLIPSLYSMTDSKFREPSNFAVPSFHSATWLEQLRIIADGRNASHSINNRYFDVNLVPVLNKGSIEVRIFRTLTERGQIIAVLNKVLDFKEKVKGIPTSTGESDDYTALFSSLSDDQQCIAQALAIAQVSVKATSNQEEVEDESTPSSDITEDDTGGWFDSPTSSPTPFDSLISPRPPSLPSTTPLRYGDVEEPVNPIPTAPLRDGETPTARASATVLRYANGVPIEPRQEDFTNLVEYRMMMARFRQARHSYELANQNS